MIIVAGIGLCVSAHAAVVVLHNFEGGTVDSWTGGTGFPDTILTAASGDTPDASTYALIVEFDTPSGDMYVDHTYAGSSWSGYDALSFDTKTPRPTADAWLRIYNGAAFESYYYDGQIASADTWTAVSIPLSSFSAPILANVTQLSLRWNSADSWQDAEVVKFDNFELFSEDDPPSGAVPEPSSAMLGGLGVALFWALRKKRAA